MKFYLILFFIHELVPQLSAVTTYHYDKPEKSRLFLEVERPNRQLNITLSYSERQKRLQPYANFYTFLHQRETNNSNWDSRSHDLSYKNITPFLKSNAIPGPFRPITREFSNKGYVPISQNIHISSTQHVLFDKLVVPKSIHSNINLTKKVNGENGYRFQNYDGNYDSNNPSQTTIETFTAKNIDIPSEAVSISQLKSIHFPSKVPIVYKHYIPILLEPSEVDQQHITKNERPPNDKNPLTGQNKYFEANHSSLEENISENSPFFHYDEKKVKNDEQFEVIRYPSNSYALEDLQTYKLVSKHTKPQVEQTGLEQEKTYSDELASKKIESSPPTKLNRIIHNSNVNFLKYLQTSKPQPEEVIINEVDNSRGILIGILNILKKQQKLTKPLIEEHNAGKIKYDENGSEITGNNLKQGNNYLSLDTPEGGTPGKPGIDYPALYSIPETSFNCKTQRYKGFFGDPETNCQVWHYCDLNGGQSSFLCPNGTVFSQIALTCDWWYNVKCSSTAQQYVLNERLYKYILPISPKFPEDYMGPLVDKYLTLKFEEMEEKMRKERRGKAELEEMNTENPEMAFV